MDDPMRTDASSKARMAAASFRARAAPLVKSAVSITASVEAGRRPEDLHKLRVALRRLRALLWAYRPMLQSDFYARQTTLLRSFADAAGQTRDWDILIALLATTYKADPALLEALRELRDEALETSREVLVHAAVPYALRATVTQAGRQIRAVRQLPFEDVLRKRVGRAGKRMRKRIKRARRADPSDYEALHAVRKSAKMLRYMLEFFESSLTKRDARTLKHLEKLQARFGTLNDAVASRALLERHRDRLPDTEAIDAAVGLLEHDKRRAMRGVEKLLRHW